MRYEVSRNYYLDYYLVCNTSFEEKKPLQGSPTTNTLFS